MDIQTTLDKLLTDSTELLSELYDFEESKAILHLLIEDITGWSRIDQIRNARTQLTTYQMAKFQNFMEALVKGVPVQHVLGYAWFDDCKFKVTCDTLIPRQETEELVHLIVNENKEKAISILDIGTGSGCIAISLKKHLKKSNVTAWDISDKALMVAKENAERLGFDVHFELRDIFDQGVIMGQYDIIVSNPPYVLESEKIGMQRQVLDYDPGLALFVPDNDPLVFYKAIANVGKHLLKNGGKIYVEINERFGAEVKTLLEASRFRHVKIIQDLNGKDRFVIANHLSM